MLKAKFHVKTGDFFEELSISNQEGDGQYLDVYTISESNITQWIKDLGFTTASTVIKLFELFPIEKVTESIFVEYGGSAFNQSLPTINKGSLFIEKYNNTNGRIEFVDIATNKKYIKSIQNGTWSGWIEIGMSSIIGNTNISNIGSGTLTSGLSVMNRNLGGNVLIAEGSGASTKYYIQSGADSASKKLLGNISNLKYGKWDVISQFLYETSWGASTISAPKAIIVTKGTTATVSATCSEAGDKFSNNNVCGYPLKDLASWNLSIAATSWNESATSTNGLIIDASTTWTIGQPSYTTITGVNYGVDILNIGFKRNDGLWRMRYVMAIVV